MMHFLSIFNSVFNSFTILHNKRKIIVYFQLYYKFTVKNYHLPIIEDCDLITVEDYHLDIVKGCSLVTVEVYHLITVEDYYLVVVKIYLYYLILL